MSISISARKAKGRKLQQWVCQQIAHILKCPYGKDQLIESRPMGQSGPDVRIERTLLAKFPYSIECKCQEKWNVPAWIEQASKNKIDNTDWLLVAKRSRERPVVIIDAVAFFNILNNKI